MALLGFRVRGLLILGSIAMWHWASAQAALALDAGQKFALIVGGRHGGVG